MQKGGAQPFLGPGAYPKDINRLITSLQPTGKVVMQEDFEVITNFANRYSVTPAGCSISNTRAFSGKASLALTADAGVGQKAEIECYLAQLPSRRVGLEFWFLTGYPVNNWDRIDSIGVGIEHWDEETNKLGRVGFNCEYGAIVGYKIPITLKYRDPTYTEQTIGTMNWYKNIFWWNNMKFIGNFDDPASPQFEYLRVGHKEFNVKGIKTYHETHNNEPNKSLWKMNVKNKDAGLTVNLYLDDIIFTCDEP